MAVYSAFTFSFPKSDWPKNKIEILIPVVFMKITTTNILLKGT
jgi:hypothetical protein